MKPLVSVIIPAFNCSRFIEQAIRSAIGQYPSQEIIVVDDGSTDDTVSRAQSFGDAVRIIRQPNRGAAAARNAGARAATGEILAFLDGDDVWLPDTLAARVDHLLQHPEVGLVWGKWREWVSEDTNHKAGAVSVRHTPAQSPAIVEGRTGWLYPELLLDSIVCTITVVLRRSIFEQGGGFDESLRLGEDYDLWLRLAYLCQMHQLDLQCARYRIHEASTTAKPANTNYELLVLKRALERHGRTGPDGRTIDEGALQKRMAKLCFDFARIHLRRGNPSYARLSFKVAARHGMRGVRFTALRLEAAARSGIRRIFPNIT